MLSPSPQPNDATDAPVGESVACREALFRVRAGDVVLAINGRVCGDAGPRDEDDGDNAYDERSTCLNYARTLEVMRTASFPLRLRLRIPDGAPPRVYSATFRASPGMHSGDEQSHGRTNRAGCEPAHTRGQLLLTPPPLTLTRHGTLTTTTRWDMNI